jgi:hypothetical protein
MPVAVTVEELLDLFERASTSVFRLETLQVYQVGWEDERWQVFLRTGQLPPPDEDRLAFVRRLEARTARGVAWSRAHIVEQPLTDYLRYELAAYAENEQGGEQVFIADRCTHPDLADLHEDFVLIDDQAVVWFRYDPDGHLLGYEHVADEDLGRCRHQRDLVLACAVRLADYRPDRAAGANGQP